MPSEQDLEVHRRDLRAHAYRLTGNVADADDLVQETFLRAWRARDRFEGRASERTWLRRIATNVFLDSRKSAARRTTPVGDVLEWSTQVGPYPDDEVAADELVELALIAALMHLPPRQRAAFVLRDVDGWTPTEIADALGVAVPAVNSLVQRARDTVRRHAPADPQDWRRPALTAQDEEILRRYAAASGPEAFRMLLADDVRITMPPDAPILGIDDAAEFLGRPLDWSTVPSRANGRPALVNYLWRPEQGRYEGWVVDVLRVVDGRIAEINAFVGGHHVAALGLPLTLAPEA
ncbi:RNA polymerase subunit sigma-70 [Cellulomonas fengjieae]|uniref:RNA polymerase sigma factor n=1 Tax=Cellulomonas fengjieae TaxID=2819978 RepID=A0ABS3SK05_9CELL|nr:RNA polymerase subunit sigma-70 [Cellulomonas fengjieae]MBO3086081.1 RNA polymerase subunit sigma-70 [Cellulomonas fengjieae]QVI65853.1 RNA polymerase subunit sigma-70 [Cellulomonas fengjieae]